MLKYAFGKHFFTMLSNQTLKMFCCAKVVLCSWNPRDLFFLFCFVILSGTWLRQLLFPLTTNKRPADSFVSAQTRMLATWCCSDTWLMAGISYVTWHKMNTKLPINSNSRLNNLMIYHCANVILTSGACAKWCTGQVRNKIGHYL